jgi:SAM-dependent methyltransferase
MQTMDDLNATPEGGLNSPASVRNAGPILEVLAAHLPARGRMLEIAGGSGQHSVAFAGALPGLEWTPSDPSPQARASMAAWADQAKLPNLQPPLALDMLDEAGWPMEQTDAVLCINMIHISPWAATQGLMRLAGRILRRPGGLLAVYGPYRETEVDLAPSNADFDVSLKSRNPDWGLRDRDAVTAEALTAGLAFTRRIEMPANNIMLLFRAV